MKLNALAITCGGTGGHFYPGLSVALTLQKTGGEALLLLSGVNAERQQEIAVSRGIQAIALPRMPLPRGVGGSIGFCSGFAGGFVQASRELRKFRAQALLGMGSFASLPAVLAARVAGVPLFLHDGNARVGKANRAFSRHAKLLATAFPACNRGKCRCEQIVTGMPLRPELERSAGINRTEAITALNKEYGVQLDSALPTILIFGGSQGAAIFNEMLPTALKDLKGHEFQVLHLAGPRKYEELKQAYGDPSFPALLLPGSERMDLFLGAADLVISRSGGSTVAELARFGKPSILIPYPYAAEDHQSDNARYLAGQDAAVLLPNEECSARRFQALIEDFLTEPERWSKRSEAARQCAKPDAAARLLEEISNRLPSRP